MKRKGVGRGGRGRRVEGKEEGGGGKRRGFLTTLPFQPRLQAV